MIGRENGQSKSSALMKKLEAVNKFFLLTKIRLKSFNESSFQDKKKKEELPVTNFEKVSLLYTDWPTKIAPLDKVS